MGKLDEFAEAMKAYPELAKLTAYYKGFKGYDGSSGYDLPFASPHIQETGIKQFGLKLQSI